MSSRKLFYIATTGEIGYMVEKHQGKVAPQGKKYANGFTLYVKGVEKEYQDIFLKREEIIPLTKKIFLKYNKEKALNFIRGIKKKKSTLAR